MKDKENTMANALSRRNGDDIECAVVTSVNPKWMNEVVESYKRDDWAQNTIKEIVMAPRQIPNYSNQNGVLRYRANVVIEKGGDIRKKTHPPTA